METNVLTTQKLSAASRAVIISAVYEVLNDPDFGLQLSEKAKQRFRKAKRSRNAGVTFSEIKRKYL